MLAAALVGGLAGCGDGGSSGSGGSATTASSTPATSELAYAEALRDAAGALADLGGVVVSGDAPEAAQSSITSALASWEDAIDRASVADLTDPGLATQRDDLVAASPDFVSAWTAVADEWGTSRGNGLLELVQQRAPITQGAQALSEAIEGALDAAGEDARGRLEGLRSEISSALEQIQAR